MDTWDKSAVIPPAIVLWLCMVPHIVLAHNSNWTTPPWSKLCKHICVCCHKSRLQCHIADAHVHTRPSILLSPYSKQLMVDSCQRSTPIGHALWVSSPWEVSDDSSAALVDSSFQDKRDLPELRDSQHSHKNIAGAELPASLSCGRILWEYCSSGSPGKACLSWKLTTVCWNRMTTCENVAGLVTAEH